MASAFSLWHGAAGISNGGKILERVQFGAAIILPRMGELGDVPEFTQWTTNLECSRTTDVSIREE